MYPSNNKEAVKASRSFISSKFDLFLNDERIFGRKIGSFVVRRET